MTPALFINTCKFWNLVLNSAAKFRIESKDDKSHKSKSTFLFPVFSMISFCAGSPRSLFRQTITTIALIFANSIAVALPIPELAPVMMQIFPSIFISYKFNSIKLLLTSRVQLYLFFTHIIYYQLIHS